MERKLSILLASFIALTLASSLTVVVPLSGLSTILGVSVLGSSVLGSSVLGSSVLGSSVLGSSVMASTTTTTTTIIAAYTQGMVISQPILSLVLIGLLLYLELTNSSNGPSRHGISELRKSWLPVTALVAILFFTIISFQILAKI